MNAKRVKTGLKPVSLTRFSCACERGVSVGFVHGASELECLPQLLQLLHAWKFASWIVQGVGIQSGLLLLQLRISLLFLCHDHSVFGLEICSMHLGMSVIQCIE